MNKKLFPSLQELELVRQKIKNIPNKKGEFLRKIHYGCFLLCSQVGLRISEAIKFDLNSKTRKGLYQIKKSKGKKTRYVYIPKKIIRELKSQN
jgi:integrase